ncbi:hypothetical protein RhiirC2_769346 [Rhizophagus irregularis]|uniref:Uncharacterized protein n=1 Tax=Rhizophagus irregularis TaxID=588596 RepID=A0A2N1NZB2_9GLOM|nr:hypothetical protein RhiirC2_769346 [Rhizophagus irregularis]
MAALVPFIPLPPPAFQWIINTARQLIAKDGTANMQLRNNCDLWYCEILRIFKSKNLQICKSANLQLSANLQIFHKSANIASTAIQLQNICANRMFAATGFAATPRQCSTKWNALKRGYENLSRIINNNNNDILIISPNNFDRACFTDMNDEFWLQTGNYY